MKLENNLKALITKIGQTPEHTIYGNVTWSKAKQELHITSVKNISLHIQNSTMH
uniref:Uncharacterized protein n=1 Tax=Amphimedon queenslandica TaxID=400682 RepID=A0A1X7V5X4_AMPQE